MAGDRECVCVSSSLPPSCYKATRIQLWDLHSDDLSNPNQLYGPNSKQIVSTLLIPHNGD
jgi:hypothetical protein